MTTTVHIGCGAGFANDRPDAALALANDLAARAGRRFLFFELLAEYTGQPNSHLIRDVGAAYVSGATLRSGV